MAGRVAFILGFALFAFLHHAGAQTVHTVGEDAGWRVPQGGATFYTNWAAGKTFAVGDSLVFNFPTNAHDVVRVPKASFDRCDGDNEIGNKITTGPATINLNSSGEYFFICTIGDHCQQGQKLSITVAATRGAAPPSSNTPRPPTTTTPSPKGAAEPPCAPTPDGPPSVGSGPQDVPPPRSSSGAVAATLSASLFGVVLSLLF